MVTPTRARMGLVPILLSTHNPASVPETMQIAMNHPTTVSFHAICQVLIFHPSDAILGSISQPFLLSQ